MQCLLARLSRAVDGAVLLAPQQPQQQVRSQVPVLVLFPTRSSTDSRGTTWPKLYGTLPRPSRGGGAGPASRGLTAATFVLRITRRGPSLLSSLQSILAHFTNINLISTLDAIKTRFSPHSCTMLKTVRFPSVCLGPHLLRSAEISVV